MKTLTEKTDTVNKYVTLFHEHQEEIMDAEPAFLSEMRREAITNFERLGFPKKKAENYKYVHLEPFFNGSLETRFAPRKLEFDIQEMFRCDIPTLDTHVLLVLNGFYYTTTGEQLVEQENGVIFGSLNEATARHPELVSQHLGKYADYRNDPFVALNTACAQDGVFLYVPEKQTLDKPLQIIHLLLSDENEMVQHRNLFIAEKHSKAEVIICDHTLSNHLFLTNSVSEIAVAENASLDVVRMQNEHNQAVQITNTWIEQHRDSTARHSTITLHGGKVRNNLQVKLKGENAHCDANGLFLIDKAQHVDNFTVIEHQQPHCTSNQHYKGVLDDAATGAFSGKIHVFPDAQKTEAYQTNNNVLLTRDAKMHTKPQLEIYADDVKCSHGATVGQIDENALFYLQTRGIPREEARLMLMYAFADEVISGIREEALRDRIANLVSRRLRGELSRCDNCAINCYD
ncbi:MAG: Fe-S cluster assembly protein SufD [Bacteroidales bacterium]|nr:Fe-S cluster assembly protein SufD [Bacteroidales bacterium]MDT8431773.1 Fe-S cluster assembly protein SufD [Bacteroidales bacterium]